MRSGFALPTRGQRPLASRQCGYVNAFVAHISTKASVSRKVFSLVSDLATGRQRIESTRKATISLSAINPKNTETELVLDQAQKDLTELCSTEGDPDCWKALNYYVSKRQQYEQHCDLEHEKGEHDTTACSSLNGLEKFTREQMVTGSIQNFRTNLLIMQRAEERRVARGEVPPTPAVLTEEEVRTRVALIRLFRALDANGDGKLGILEFQDGMEALGAVITEKDIQQISDSLTGGDNSLDIDEFMEVMDASPLLRGVAIGNDSNFLRHAAQVHGPQHLGGAKGPHLTGYVE